FLLKRFVEGSGIEPLARHLLWTSVIPPAVLERLGCQPSGLDSDLDRAPGPGTGLDALQLHDLESYLAEGLLTKADRASMGWALEPRAPYLDRKVLDFAASLPGSERVRGLGTKVFLKRYALRYLPRAVVHQRKRGLSVPLAAWLRGPLRAWARERLESGRLQRCGVDTQAVLDLFREHVEREADWGRALWSLLVLTEWLEWWETSSSESA
ncbi:MAG TPA: asparagine synthase-related protein, partial [Vicinamibacteria bacterium]|nr:asparagine synthase-related protein [Vicinamibacteria bacterium]